MATTPSRKTHRSSQSSPTHFTLLVELIDTEPTIWRRIHIDGRARLDAFHHVLQAAMGWSDSHLHEFEVRGRHYGTPDPGRDDDGHPIFSEKKFRLNQVLSTGDTCLYLYDFGDSWHHRITVKSIEDLDERIGRTRVAWVEAGARACPPEDAGGVGQYQEFLDSLENDPYSDETKETREWAGLDFDPGRYDRQAANNAINRLLWNGWIKIGA
jgi:hypothetical protein